MQKSAYTPTLGTQKEVSDSATSDNATSRLLAFFSSPFKQSAVFLANKNWGTTSDYSNQVNPLIKMQVLGDVTLTTAETALTLYTVAYGSAAAVDHSIAGKIGEFTQNPAGTAKDVLGILAPVFYFTMLMLFGIGFSLAVFLPAVPFLYWMVGVINWLVSVLVGCAAGPMWAVTHLGAEEDKGSRSAHGYIFLIDMMLRPSLMVLGFFFASVAMMAAGTLLNMLFGPALNSANADSLVGLVKMIGWLLIYARIATFTVTRLFGLQATLPDYVITFLGGSGMNGIMGGMVDDVKGMFGAFGSGVQRTPGVKDLPLRKDAPGSHDGLK
jgi:conjugal transfer/type IV secretion protein DotA/TraY